MSIPISRGDGQDIHNTHSEKPTEIVCMKCYSFILSAG